MRHLRRLEDSWTRQLGERPNRVQDGVSRRSAAAPCVASDSGAPSLGGGPRPHVHFVGIGGAGLSALARLALSQGWMVSGSDAADSPRLEHLRRMGAKVYVGHSALHLCGGPAMPDALVVTSAVRGTNWEVLAAQALGVRVYKRSEWLARVTDPFLLVGVAGTHGKTTTTAMLATSLRAAGSDVTAVVGGDIAQFPDGANAVLGGGPWFVLEADEYDRTFLGLTPTIAVVTNVEWEHVDMFPTEQDVVDAFRAYACRVAPSGTLLVCAESPLATNLGAVYATEAPADEGEQGSAGVAEAEEEDTEQESALELLSPSAVFELAAVGGDSALELGAQPALFSATRPAVGKRRARGRAGGLEGGRRVMTYGLRDGCDWQALNLSPNPQGGTDYTAVCCRRPVGRVQLRMPGVHNVLNSLAAIAVASEMAAHEARAAAADESAVAAAGEQAARRCAEVLGFFEGVSRRFEHKGTHRLCTVFDDYAHHPTEVQATLQAARQRFGDREVWAVFQPHTHSRVAKLADALAGSFTLADRVVVTDIYGAREAASQGVTSEDLTARITGPPAVCVLKLEDVVSYLSAELAARAPPDAAEPLLPPPVVITLGAGDVTTLGGRLLAALPP